MNDGPFLLSEIATLVDDGGVSWPSLAPSFEDDGEAEDCTRDALTIHWAVLPGPAQVSTMLATLETLPHSCHGEQ